MSGHRSTHAYEAWAEERVAEMNAAIESLSAAARNLEAEAKAKGDHRTEGRPRTLPLSCGGASRGGACCMEKRRTGTGIAVGYVRGSREDLLRKERKTKRQGACRVPGNRRGSNEGLEDSGEKPRKGSSKTGGRQTVRYRRRHRAPKGEGLGGGGAFEKARTCRAGILVSLRRSAGRVTQGLRQGKPKGVARLQASCGLEPASYRTIIPPEEKSNDDHDV